MAIEFDEFIKLRSIPASPQIRARQAALIQRRLTAAGNLDLIRAEALSAINNTAVGDAPGEEKRLRLLYRNVYTQDELEAFVNASLAELGFDD